MEILTDESKCHDTWQAGIVISIPNHNITNQGLHHYVSTYTAELSAVSLALITLNDGQE